MASIHKAVSSDYMEPTSIADNIVALNLQLIYLLMLSRLTCIMLLRASNEYVSVF